MRPASVGFQCPDDVASGRRSVRASRTAVGAKVLQSPPYATIVLIVANIVVYVITGLQSVKGINDPEASKPTSLFNTWELVPQFVHDQHDYYELLTSAFLHVSLLHIASNMVVLAIIGPPLEAVLGRWRFVAVYFVAALGGGAAIYALGAPLGPTVGASGAIFGLFGTALVLVRRIGLDLQWLVGIVVLNFVITFSIPDISKLGHIGGFVTGLLAGLAIGGLPTRPGRLSLRTQLAGLGGVLVLVVLVVLLRTLTW